MTHPKWTRRHALHAMAAASAMASVPLRAQDNAAAASDAASAAYRDPKEIRIGQSIHLTGPLAPSIAAVIQGQNLAIDEFNRKGGLQGHPVRLISLDDANDVKKCVDNVNTLIDRERVVALYGLAGPANVAAVLPILSEKKVPLVGVYNGSPVLRAKQHPYFFTTMASYRDEVVQMVRDLVMLQKSQIGLAYQNSPFGLMMKPVVEEVVKELGATLVAQVPLEANGSDAMAAAQLLAAAKPQTVMFMAFGPSIVPFVKAVRAHVADAPILCVSVANSPELLKVMGDQARGLAFAHLVPYPYRQSNTVTRDLAAALARAKLEVDYDYMSGYISTRILLEGLRRAGKLVTPANVVKGMESMNKYDMGGYPVSYGPNKHHGSTFVEVAIVGSGGRWVR